VAAEKVVKMLEEDEVGRAAKVRSEQLALEASAAKAEAEAAAKFKADQLARQQAAKAEAESQRKADELLALARAEREEFEARVLAVKQTAVTYTEPVEEGAAAPSLPERDYTGAAALTASVVGFKIAGPVGSLAAAALVSYFGKKDAAKGVIQGTGKAAVGTADLLKSVDEKFEVVKSLEKVFLEAVKGSADTHNSDSLEQRYQQTKSALGASFFVGKDVLKASMDVTDKFLDKVDELKILKKKDEYDGLDGEMD
jgi:hypothetical protein